MDQRTALDRLTRAAYELQKRRPQVEKRERYARGDQELPFAPVGVNTEYVELQKQSIAAFLPLAVEAPVQRLGVDSFRTGLTDAVEVSWQPEPMLPDDALWTGAWQANKLDSRQSIIYRSMFVHGRGIASVWPNKLKKSRPIVRPESFGRVHIEMDPDDPFTPLWAAKVYTVEVALPTSLVMPAGVSSSTTKTVGIVYDATSMMRFEKQGGEAFGTWKMVAESTHPMRAVPFAVYDYRPDADGQPFSAVDGLMAQQDAINTIRFNTLLAMQFAAFRQRIITGFDPRVLDKDGNVVYKTKEDGTPLLDSNGNPIPVVSSPGRVGVDRMLVFPGGETKVFDMAESNLANYIAVYDKFLSDFFSVAQIPPQYQLGKMANLSGDALAAAESTLASLVKEMQLAAGEGHETVAELAWAAMGQPSELPPASETEWGDREARSFAAIADAVTKLVSVEFPHRAAFEMLPGATKQKVDRWMDEREDEKYQSSVLGQALRPFQDVTGPAPAGDQPALAGAVPAGEQVTDGAPSGGS
jgi:hypothetical protein